MRWQRPEQGSGHRGMAALLRAGALRSEECALISYIYQEGDQHSQCLSPVWLPKEGHPFIQQIQQMIFANLLGSRSWAGH